MNETIKLTELDHSNQPISIMENYPVLAGLYVLVYFDYAKSWAESHGEIEVCKLLESESSESLIHNLEEFAEKHGLTGWAYGSLNNIQADPDDIDQMCCNAAHYGSVVGKRIVEQLWGDDIFDNSELLISVNREKPEYVKMLMNTWTFRPDIIAYAYAIAKVNNSNTMISLLDAGFNSEHDKVWQTELKPIINAAFSGDIDTISKYMESKRYGFNLQNIDCSLVFRRVLAYIATKTNNALLEQTLKELGVWDFLSLD